MSYELVPSKLKYIPKSLKMIEVRDGLTPHHIMNLAHCGISVRSFEHDGLQLRVSSFYIDVEYNHIYMIDDSQVKFPEGVYDDLKKYLRDGKLKQLLG